MLDTTPGGHCNHSELVGVLTQGGVCLYFWSLKKNFEKNFLLLSADLIKN